MESLDISLQYELLETQTTSFYLTIVMEEPTAKFCGLALRGKISGKIYVSSADRQDRLWAPPSLVFNANRRSLPEVTRPRREADH